VKTSGGVYTYIQAAFGDVCGFVYLWSDLLIMRPLSVSLSSLATAEYLMRPFFLDCPDYVPRIARTLIALVVLCK
jgi:amino acid transporter